MCERVRKTMLRPKSEHRHSATALSNYGVFRRSSVGAFPLIICAHQEPGKRSTHMNDAGVSAKRGNGDQGPWEISEGGISREALRVQGEARRKKHKGKQMDGGTEEKYTDYTLYAASTTTFAKCIELNRGKLDFCGAPATES